MLGQSVDYQSINRNCPFVNPHQANLKTVDSPLFSCVKFYQKKKKYLYEKKTKKQKL